jgi:8-oxo-dGTP pyrophosphatase MutT (NUDIX family)
MPDAATHANWAGLVTRLKQLATGEIEPAPVRHASTVVLMRDRPSADGFLLYLLRRSPALAFSGFYVFPGGSVDLRDEEIPDTAWVGPSPDVWSGVLGCDELLARALVCAAVRETFEESGVVLAGPDAGSIVSDVSGDDWETDRLALLDRSLSFAELLSRRGLVLRADLLSPWAHWITPLPELKRFDTRFFVAAMPTGQRTRDVGGESDRVLWASPAEAVARNTAGEMSMLPPTVSTIAELATYDSVASVLAAGGAHQIEAVLPMLVLGEGDRVKYLLPNDPGYAEIAGR